MYRDRGSEKQILEKAFIGETVWVSAACARQHIQLLRLSLRFQTSLEDAERNRKKENKTDEELRKHKEKDDGRRKRRILKHAARRSRSREDRVERDAKKKKRSSKSESMSAESISDSEL